VKNCGALPLNFCRRFSNQSQPCFQAVLSSSPGIHGNFDRASSSNLVAFPTTPTTWLERQDQRILHLPTLNPSYHGNPNIKSIPNVNDYGKWADLIQNSRRLELEARVSDELVSPGGSPPTKLVNLPENEQDLSLWACLLNHQQTKHSDEGVLSLWQEVARRRKLRDVESRLAKHFWSTILAAALKDNDALQEVWLYAKWLSETFGCSWPALYETILTFCLTNRQYDRALHWHLRLVPSFDPGPGAFTELIKRFVAESDSTLQATLRSLYISSAHRHLYDSVISYLHYHGKSNLAYSWRTLFVRHSDFPSPLSPSRPYLQFVAAYNPNIVLVHEEKVAALMTNDQVLQHHLQSSSDFREAMNRFHGDTFGIKEKQYNDSIGSRWFASTWISLDFAINTIQALGVKQIGPLSLQSIALRELNTQGVAYRLRQLQDLKIGIGASVYAKAVQHFAENGRDSYLAELLQSDIHPDVFDDFETQKKMLGSCVSTRDWRIYRLLLAVHLVVARDAAGYASNLLLQKCLNNGNNRLALKVLDDMLAMSIQASGSSGSAVNQVVLRDVLERPNPQNPESLANLDAAISLCRRMNALQIPVSVGNWDRIFCSLGRLGRFDELEGLAVELTKWYTSAGDSERKTLPVHHTDLPTALISENSLFGGSIPADLDPAHKFHPLRKLFSLQLQKSIVRWSIKYAPEAPNYTSINSGKRDSLADFYIARGVRLLHLLKERGVLIESAPVRKFIITALVGFFSPSHSRRQTRYLYHLSLRDWKTLFDEAWGSEILPAESELASIISRKVERAIMDKSRKGGRGYNSSTKVNRRRIA
jgi:hypothetical protein